MAKPTTAQKLETFAQIGQVPFVQNAFYELGPTFCIHSAITADPLHVIYIGIFGYHLWGATKKLIEDNHGSTGLDLVDSRICRIPTSPGFSHFPHGVTTLSRLTKKDYQSIMIQLLPCIMDLVSSDVVTCLRTLFDIAMMISNTSHTEASLNTLEQYLIQFDGQLDVFRMEKDMDFPKMHALSLHLRGIRWHGAADSFGTEHMEAMQRCQGLRCIKSEECRGANDTSRHSYGQSSHHSSTSEQQFWFLF
ncbi:hypothetical protein BDR26DRAFT_805737 [Obelidium mucronatum]|nr:hypothetical protein BDR26DRAFT_805737 [Obelidium mucronatum]